MNAFSLFAEPAIKVAAHLSSALTYETVPCKVADRADSCSYLGHIPFFAPKAENKAAKE